MTKLSSDREIATQITFKATSRTERLTYIGSGTTCIVYETDAKDIIKEFSPLINVNGKYVSVMSRKTHSNSELTPLKSLSPSHLKLIEERREAFDSQIAIIDELNCRYRNEEDNMFLIPMDMPETTLGICHWCNYIGGRNLETVFADSKKENEGDFQKHFLNVLPLIISLYDEIAFYHRDQFDDASTCGILNLDIKPENLFAIKSQGKYIGIRNLDFGSAQRIEDKYHGDTLKEAGLITKIRKYALKNNCPAVDPSSQRINQIALKFFASSPGFYDTSRIEKIIRKCLQLKDGESSADIVSELKLLDILAAWKTFLFALCDSPDLFATKDVNNRNNEKSTVKKAFSEIFEKNHLTQNNSLFESYNIYTQLYEIMGRCFGEKEDRLSASKIADRLRSILYIFSNVQDHQKTADQIIFHSINTILNQEDHLLGAHDLNTIKDILDFCDANGLKKNETPADLYWFLKFGEKHK